MAFCYWRNLSFLKIDLLLMMLGWHTNPYRLLKKRGVEPYGETPLSTFDFIARQCRILSDDVVIDLGCGRGRLVFWLATHVKCRAIGMDLVELFVQRAERVTRWLGVDRAAFWCGDFTTLSLVDATVIYLYGSAFDDDRVKVIAEHLLQVKSGVRLITISYSLEELHLPGFTVEKCFVATFPWGKTNVYLQTRQ